MCLLHNISGVSDEELLAVSDTKYPAVVPLKSGPFSLIYEAGNLRYIRLGSHEVIRMVYAACRGTSWETVIPEINDEQINISADSFSISYQAIYRKAPLFITAQVEIIGDKNGRIIFRFVGEAQTVFSTNRIGLCLLQPLECIGNTVIIAHSDGRTESLQFPKLISSHKLSVDVQNMVWNPDEFTSLSVDFTGDTFETEDQRNWCDASFKTYPSNPSAISPFKLNPGDIVEQSVCIQALKFPNVTNNTKQQDEILVSVSPDIKYQFPFIGIRRPNQAEKLNDTELKMIKRLALDHYRVDIHFKDKNWLDIFTNGNSEAKKLGLPLLIALFFYVDTASEAKQFIEKCFDIFPQIEEIILFMEDREASSRELFDEVEALIREGLHHARIGVGSPYGFSRFNQNGPYHGRADFLVFASNPQENARDNRTIIENLQAYASILKTVIHNEGNRPVYLSPFNLLPPDSSLKHKDSFQDQRLHSIFGAGWTLGALQYIAEAGFHSVTLFETTGKTGIIGRQQEDENAIIVAPVYLLLNLVLEHKGFVLRTESSDSKILNALVTTAGNKSRLFLLNHTDKELDVRIKGISGDALFWKTTAELVRSFSSRPDEFKNIPSQSMKIDDSVLIKLDAFAIDILEIEQSI